MAAWREEDHPRDERGRWIPKGLRAAVQRRRTVEHVESADESELLDVFVRIAGKDRITRKDERDLLRLDAELKRREAGGEQQPTPEQRRVDELLAGGASYDEAYREAYGRAGDELDDDSSRRKGETREAMRRREYAELTALRLLEAEDACRGYLLTKEGAAAGIDPVSLFSGPEARARKYASEELLRWWESNPRSTYAEYRADRVGDAGGATRARKTSRAAATGRKYGSAAANKARSRGGQQR